MKNNKIMNDLINIKVIQKEFNGEKKRFVNARELHGWLGVGKFFANWIKDRINKYDFTENLDYFIAFPQFGDGLKLNKTGKLDEKVVVSILEHTTQHGAIAGKIQNKFVKYYNLDTKNNKK